MDGDEETLLLLAENANALAARLAGRLPEGLRIVACSDSGSALRDGVEASIALASPALLADCLDGLPRLRWAQSTWAGVRPLVDHPRRNYRLTGVRGIFGQAMSEWVLGWLLALERGILRRGQTRHWDDSPDGTLAGKHLGILGTGSIGQAVAGQVATLGIRCRGLNRSGDAAPGFEETFAAQEALRFADGCDYLLALLPDTVASASLVDSRLLAALPRGAVFLNGGRGSTVDTDAVVSALGSGHLRAAVLDVLPEEPLADDDALWSVERLYITSHTAAPTDPDAIIAHFCANLSRYRADEPLADAVDFNRGY